MKYIWEKYLVIGVCSVCIVFVFLIVCLMALTSDNHAISKLFVEFKSNGFEVQIPSNFAGSLTATGIVVELIKAVVLGASLVMATYVFNKSLESFKIRIKHAQQLKSKELNLVHALVKKVSAINIYFLIAIKVASSKNESSVSDLNMLNKKYEDIKAQTDVLSCEIEAALVFIGKNNYEIFVSIEQSLRQYFSALPYGNMNDLFDMPTLLKCNNIGNEVRQQILSLEI